jgi:hypothetical protein
MGLTQVSTDGVKNDAITKTKIPANQIEASELADNAVDTNAIANDAITRDKIADDVIASEHFIAGEVDTTALATNAVTTAKIADEAVTLAKLEHGTGSNDGKFLRANNGADPSFETVNLSPNFGNQEIITTDTVKTPTINDGQVAFRNMVVNGSFMVNQRVSNYDTPSAVTITNNSNDYPCDMWHSNSDTMSQFSLQRMQDTAVIPTLGTQYFLRATMLSAEASPVSQLITHAVEGYTGQRLRWGTSGAKQATLSFWFRCSITGTFGGSISSANNNLCFPFSFTYSNANSWQYVSYVIAPTTSGTFYYDHQKSFGINFSLGNNSGRQAAAGSWHSGFRGGPTGETNICASNGATVDIAQVQMELGDTATEFEHRSYQQTLMDCMRYYQKVITHGSGGGNATGGLGGTPYSNGSSLFCPYRFPVQMRRKPTVESSGVATFRTRLGNNHDFNGFSGYNDAGDHSATLITQGQASGANVGQYTWIETNAGAYLALRSELY